MRTAIINIPNQEWLKVISFPDGQQDVVLHPRINAENVLIESRFNSFRDLELIICTVKALRGYGMKNINLKIPYLLGARSDRKFVNGGNSYLRDVIAPILNGLNLEGIVVFDVHSDVAAACIDNLIVESNYRLVRQCLPINDNITIISPDAGASKKVFELCKDLKFSGEVITCDKHRDISTGKIVSVSVPEFNVANDVVIIDDICDGGRTFIEIAKIVKQRTGKKLTLIVSHGIFSNGFGELEEYFDEIFTTNSIKDSYESPIVKVYKLI
jgi:ribose-phosphate pyrophosphokinase